MEKSTTAKKRNKRSKRKGVKIPLCTQSSGSSAEASCAEGVSSLEGSGEHNSTDNSPEVVLGAPSFGASGEENTSPTVEDSGVSELERQLAEACMDEDRRGRSSDEEPFFVLEEAPGTGILVSFFAFFFSSHIFFK